jgi:putative NADH-flavin reductase
MRIAVYGASGMVGSRVAAEAVARGHEVTGVTRSGGELPDGVKPVEGDALDADLTAEVARNHDVVVSALGPSRTAPDEGRFVSTVENLVETLGDARLVVVGGAGSLQVGGVRLVDSPEFPEAYKSESLIGAASLALLRALGEGPDWTYLSPAPVIAPGARTGRYRSELETPAGDFVSAEDYAVALVDEIETPRHRRGRFTVASEAAAEV